MITKVITQSQTIRPLIRLLRHPNSKWLMQACYIWQRSKQIRLIRQTIADILRVLHVTLTCILPFKAYIPKCRTLLLYVCLYRYDWGINQKVGISIEIFLIGRSAILVGGEKSFRSHRAMACVQVLTYKVSAKRYTVRGQNNGRVKYKSYAFGEHF